MTHAEAVALRDAGQLDPNCVVVITDGPVIGTPGNTSPTQIELNPAGPGDIGRTARIHTTFDNVAFAGLYNIDDGASGAINSITDHWNNRVSDEDPGAPTVHTQFPYHMASALLRDNDVNDCTLTGWDTAVAAGVLITDNELLNAGIHLGGMTAGTFIRNRVQGPQITVSSPDVLFSSNDIRNAEVTFESTNALTQSFQGNTLLGGRFNVTAATTGRVTVGQNVIGGQGVIGYRVLVDGATANVTISGNRLFNQGADPTADLRVAGSGAAAVTGNDIGAGTVVIENTGTATINGNKMIDPTVSKLGTGTFTVERNTVTRGTITQNATSTATLNMVDSQLEVPNITLAAGSSNQVIISSGNTGALTLNHQGQGPVQIFANTGRPAIATSAASTRGLIVNSNTGRFTVNQNGTGNPGVVLDNLLGSVLQDGMVNFNSTLAGTGPNTVSGTIDGQSVVNVIDAASPNCMSQTRVGGFSQLNIQPGGSVSRCRFDADVEVNTGAFGHINSIAEGDFVVTATAANVNRLLNKSFSDWI
jgi:hypothetical protein